ncbi:MAG: hypothetical protein ABQ298_13335 [Puniceicoccaceae bacterium]
MDLLKTLYEVAGSAHPKTSIMVAALVGAVFFGGSWWLIGKQYEKEKKQPSTESNTNQEDSRISRYESVSKPNDSDDQIVEELIESGYATLISISDTKGNKNTNSWGKKSGGHWSSANQVKIYPGDVIRISATAASPEEKLIEYKFSLQKSGMSFVTKQEWSSDSEWEWSVREEDIGRDVTVMVSVRCPKDFFQFNDSDDYTYAIYDVLPKPSKK